MRQEIKQEKDLDKMLNRKGATNVVNIPAAVRSALNKGVLESVNLTEWLAVDHFELLQHVLADYPELLKSVQHKLSGLPAPSVRTLVVEIGGAILSENNGQRESLLFDYLANHRSDSVRCWAVYMVGLNQHLDLETKLNAIRPFAADHHFGVRELAWMALRDDIAAELPKALKLLEKWTNNPDENIRRFATEATRPRGVWCKHITALKEEPQLAIRLLESLKADPAAYVQLSVGNWLNDAGKNRPDWVLELCRSWTNGTANEHTLKIVKRATRNIPAQP
jgi:3-methyladenine DNA glycosylase AlkC